MRGQAEYLQIFFGPKCFGTSDDSGGTWTERDPTGGVRACSNVASSTDGVKIAACAEEDYIYTSNDGGRHGSKEIQPKIPKNGIH